MKASQKPKASPQAEASSRLNDWLRANFVRYQLDWIFERAAFAVHNKARQIGVSDAISGDAVVHGFAFRRPQIILSANEDLSTEVLAKARLHCQTLAACGFHAATKFSVDNTTELAWHSGGRIIALPANARTARSFSGDVHLDEFAYHLDPEGIRDGAFAMASRLDWRVRIISTPNGAQGLFYDYVSNTPKGWALHTTSIHDAQRDGLVVNLQKLWDLCGGDERIFAQWFLCSFIDADLQYIPTAFVDRAKIDILPSLDGCDIFAGIDVGRTQDLTVISIVAVTPQGRAYLLDQATCKRTKFSQQRKLFEKLRETYGWQRVCIDSTGLGSQLAEELVEEWGEDEVEALVFTLQSKEDLATRMLRFLREKRFKMRQNDGTKRLAAELVAMRRVVQPSGRVVYESPRTSQGHGDRAWSLALALRAAEQAQIPRGMGKSPLLSVA